MALNYSTLVYLPIFDVFARPITVLPKVSNPGAPAYSDMRGIFDTDDADVMGIDGSSVIADQKTILDIREDEFIAAGHMVPEQGDIVTVPAVDALRGRGDWEVMDADDNGGGEITLTIRRWDPPRPDPIGPIGFAMP